LDADTFPLAVRLTLFFVGFVRGFFAVPFAFDLPDPGFMIAFLALVVFSRVFVFLAFPAGDFVLAISS